jgi:hypothetical protein
MQADCSAIEASQNEWLTALFLLILPEFSGQAKEFMEAVICRWKSYINRYWQST